MTMSVQLFVLACAFALSTADIPKPTPQYEQTLHHVDDAWAILNTNIVSMDGNIPLLNDYRRHYTEIIYVIMYEGRQQAGCVHLDYFEEYQQNLAISAPEAIKNPEVVIAEIKELTKRFDEKTNQLQNLIRECTGSLESCNEYIDSIVNKNNELQNQKNVLMAAGDFASILNTKGAEFYAIANHFTADEFVVKGADDLEAITRAYAYLYNILFLYPQSC